MLPQDKANQRRANSPFGKGIRADESERSGWSRNGAVLVACTFAEVERKRSDAGRPLSRVGGGGR